MFPSEIAGVRLADLEVYGTLEVCGTPSCAVRGRAQHYGPVNAAWNSAASAKSTS